MTEPNQPHTYAGFLVRLGAALIDAIILALIITPILNVIYGDAYWDSESFILGFWDFTLNYVCPIAFTVFCWLKYQATPGKAFFKLKVIDINSGKKVKLSQAVIRYLCYLLSALPLMIGYLWALFNERKLTFHDLIAKTAVVRR